MWKAVKKAAVLGVVEDNVQVTMDASGGRKSTQGRRASV